MPQTTEITTNPYFLVDQKASTFFSKGISRVARDPTKRI